MLAPECQGDARTILGMPSPEWNRTEADFPIDEDYSRLIGIRARHSPDAPALTYRGRSLTYAQVNSRANQLARHLRSVGIGPGCLVGICTDRSPAMVIGLLGILKAGAAYVPLDPSYPRDRLAYMVEDAGLAALLTQTSWHDCLPKVEAPTVLLDKTEQWAKGCAEEIDLGASPDDLAYVIYTSGSTGKPKGVAITRRSFTNFLWSMQRKLELSERDVMLAITTISFDIAGLEIFLPLMVGGRVVLATRQDASDASRLLRLLEEEGVSTIQATPATWRMLLGTEWKGNGRLQILCGGEAMTRDLADLLLEKSTRVWNMYGPTETTVWSTMCRVEPGTEPISIGRPIDNTTIHILDESLHPVTVGEVGELHIGGVGVARGYLNRPDLTAEKFIPDPFSEETGSRLYRTGDLARYWPDGRIECLGRVDHQVKIRGFRIELPEIEARLNAHPGVKQSAVIARDDSQGDKFLVAYWQPSNENGSGPGAEELKQFVGESLPRHMVPHVYVMLNALPLTPNGKIDRRALPEPDLTARSDGVEFVPAGTPTQQKLLEIWEHLLGVSPIGIRDDFFSLGGHSLAAARIVAKIESEMSVMVPVATLLSSPTVEALARIIDGEAQPRNRGVVVPFRESGTRPPLFLVAGVGGHVLIFRELAELLGEDQPVYGLQGIGLDGTESPVSSMEEIAARYVREIVSMYPQGPYYVSGWSMGGIIAYEMALQLLQEKRELGRLIVMDAYAPWVLSFKDRLLVHVSNFRKRSFQSKVNYLKQRVTHQVEVLGRRLGFDRVEGLEGPTADRVRASSLAQFEALRRYAPRPFPGDMTLLRAEQTEEIRDPRADDAALGWGTLVQGAIQVLPIRGSHTGIFVGRNVQTVAAALRFALDIPAESPTCHPDLC